MVTREWAEATGTGRRDELVEILARGHLRLLARHGPNPQRSRGLGESPTTEDSSDFFAHSLDLSQEKVIKCAGSEAV